MPIRQKISLWVLVGCLVALFFLPKNIERIDSYSPPPLDHLLVAQGPISFRPQWKSTGGELILKQERRKLVLTCAPPNEEHGFSCHREPGSPAIDFKHQVSGKHGKIWWEPVVGSAHGRLYQLEIDGKMFIVYEDMARYYKKHFDKKQK